MKEYSTIFYTNKLLNHIVDETEFTIDDVAKMFHAIYCLEGLHEVVSVRNKDESFKDVSLKEMRDNGVKAANYLLASIEEQKTKRENKNDN